MAGGVKNLDLDEMLSNRDVQPTDSPIAAADRAHQWHPYTQMKDFGSHLPVVKAKGSKLYLEDGRVLIDAISSWWVNLYGHGNEHIQAALHAQFESVDHVLFAGFTHKPATRVAELLIPLLPGKMNRLFFSDNGSTSVEVAMKMALQYFYNKGENRRLLLAFEDAYHGDTFGAMATGGLGVFNSAFSDMLPKVVRIPVPSKNGIEATLEALHSLPLHEVAGFIYEPLVQGAAGMVFYEAADLDKVLNTVKNAGAFLIADEVMTGFGRLETMFASEQMDIKPDIMCLSKGLTGGVLPMGLTTATEEVYNGFYSDDRSKALMHGHSFTANPLGCATAIAGLELWASPDIQAARQQLISLQKEAADSFEKHPAVESARAKGTLLAISIKTNSDSEHYGEFRDKLYAYFTNHGILLRPLGNVIYTLPPYTTSESEMKHIYDTIQGCLDTLVDA